MLLALVAAFAFKGQASAERALVDAHIYRASILPPEGVIITDTTSTAPARRLALSPDGRRLAFTAAGRDGKIRLWVRPLEALAAQALEGTEGATFPFWSPDGRFLAFFAEGQSPTKLKKIDLSGGPPLTLCDAPTTAPVGTGGTWNRDDVILFGMRLGIGIQRVSASGGTPVPLTSLDAKSGETEHWAPVFLPDGRHFLYLALGSAPLQPLGVYVASLDSKDRKLLLRGGSNAKYAQGYLTFLREQTLMAQPFDIGRLELTGDPVPIAEQVAIGGASGKTGAFSVSDTGVLAFQTGAGTAPSQLLWFDRSGKQSGALGEEADQADIELSPDGKRIAVAIFDPAKRTRDIWMYDAARGNPRQRPLRSSSTGRRHYESREC